MNERMRKFEHEMERSVREFMHDQGRVKGFYYEVWIDFYEDFEESIYPVISSLSKEYAVRYCLKYMERREVFYSSPHYCQMLDRMLSGIDEKDWVPN